MSTRSCHSAAAHQYAAVKTLTAFFLLILVPFLCCSLSAPPGQIVERRYPVLLRRFSLRANSGGEGMFRGGDGAVREFEFLAPLSVGILSERRAFAPFGMHGGRDGARGRNTLLVRRPGAAPLELQLGAKNSYHAAVGDRVRIESPGGGAWGLAARGDEGSSGPSMPRAAAMAELGSVEQYRLASEQA